MGVAFAEVSPDFCVCIDTHCYRGAFFAATGGICDYHSRRLHARRMGMGSAERLNFAHAARVAGGALWAAVSADAVYAAGVSSQRSPAAG